MKREENPLYMEDVQKTAQINYPWEKLQNSSFLISGASGMIGSFLTDVLMYRNRHYGMNCRITALGRNRQRAQERFGSYMDSGLFQFRVHDINEPLSTEWESADYVLHAASNTHPVAYATDPINTVAANIIGTSNLLEFASACASKRFVFVSTVEVYGENRGDQEYFDEKYCGYIDCNTLRAGYPESKRCGEALCQAYISQKNMDIVIPRLARTYGPTMLRSDTKAISQFLKNGLAHEDIVLKSRGTQLYSYTYVADAVSGILAALFYGQCGEAYNIADPASDLMLKDLAGMIAEISGTKVVFELPDAVEAAGYSKATKAVMDGAKLKALGWNAMYSMREGLERTLDILSGVL